MWIWELNMYKLCDGVMSTKRNINIYHTFTLHWYKKRSEIGCRMGGEGKGRFMRADTKRDTMTNVQKYLSFLLPLALLLMATVNYRKFLENSL